MVSFDIVLLQSLSDSFGKEFELPDYSVCGLCFHPLFVVINRMSGHDD